MFYNGRIIITLNSFPVSAEICKQCQNVRTMELSLNVKKLLILHLVWKTNRILQYGSLFFIMGLILVLSDNLPKYGRTITKSFLGTVLTTGFGASTLSKNSFMHLSTKSQE